MSFAFKIDKALRANLYKICRLCGIDRDETVPILGGDNSQNADEELELHQKIKELIGILISKDDKMPQSACTLCVDKINDFYEFREMCYATNIQTRKLLGLKGDGLKKAPVVEVKPPVVVKEESSFLKRMRKRKADESPQNIDMNDVKRETGASLAPNKKQRLSKQADKSLKLKEEIKDEPLDVSATATTNNISKFRQLCNICEQRFGSKAKLEAHQANTHIPNIPRYVCTACDETIKKAIDIKNHQLWHKLSKTPYTCGLCGQCLTSSYAYSRHLRDHCAEIPSSLLVLDRECPQCHQTFITNFLYNTHPCAVRTKKCAGCNRALRNELEYQRHAATCAKVYLKYSTHIPAAAVVAESCVRIKNENDVEAAAAAEALARNAGLSLDMAPVVSLTRMSTPVLLSANHCVALPPGTEIDGEGELQTNDTKQGKKSGRKGVSKKELKRVDDLLKSTLDALVSIKHEPEVHVTDGVTDAHATGRMGNAATGDESDNEHTTDDFHHGDDDDDADDGGKVGDGGETSNVTKALPSDLGIVAVKQEVLDESYKEHYANTPVNIKQEVMDIADIIDVDAENTPSTKMPVLKLKIKKEHGTLNSSLIDDEGTRSEKRKKKKKRKEVEKSKEKSDKNQNLQESISTTDNNQVNAANVEDSLMPLASVMPRIKQEPLDEALEVDKAVEEPQMQGEATVMTSIPRMQFQIACISSGVDFAAANDADEGAAADDNVDVHTVTARHEEMPDIKPNRAELDRMLMITSVSSGVDMAAEEEPTNENCVPTAGGSKDQSAKLTPTKTARKVTSVRSGIRSGTGKAVKSTGGVKRKEGTEVGVVDGMDLGNIRIKAEPVDRGYEDVYNNQYETELDTMPTSLNEFTISEVDDEQAYLNTIDFANIKIKQERDEISEMEMCSSQLMVPAVPNGLASLDGNRRESQMSMEGSVSDDSSGEEEEETSEVEEEEEVREYREMDLPPLLSNTATNEANDNLNDCEDKNHSVEAEQVETNEVQFQPAVGEEGIVTENTAIITQASTCLKIAAVTAGCTDFHKVAMNNASEDAAGNAATFIEPTVEAETLRLEVREEPEANLKAQPFFENTVIPTEVANNADENNGDDNSATGENVTQSSGEEEQQNLLNHEVAEQVLSTAASTLQLSMNFDRISLERESHAEPASNVAATVPQSTSTSTSANANNDEETENLINESAAEAQRLQQQQQSARPCSSASAGGVRVGSGIAINHFLLDDSNINEIAENNNNANIERELEDVVAAAERVRSSELELERRANDIT